jgi:hypothetical protein
MSDGDIPPPPPPPDPEGWQPQFEAPDDSRFSPPSSWRRGGPVEPRALSLSDIVERAFAFYRMHWKALIAFVAILEVPLQFVEQYVLRNYHRVGLYAVGSSQGEPPRVGQWVWILTAIGLLIVQPILTVGTTRAVAWFHLGGTPSAGEILRGAIALLPSAIVVVLLVTIAEVLGFLLLILPGIYLWVRLQFAPSALALDGQRGTYALRRSWRLTARNFWRVFGITLVAVIMAAVASAIVSLPFILPTLNGGPGEWWIRAIGPSLGSVVAIPFTQMVTVLLYFDLRVRKEGLTLDQLQWEASSAGPGFGT